MTGAAARLAMRPLQNELCLRIVIEFPQAPAGRAVALAALVAETRLVAVVLPVTILALRARALVSLVKMAALTSLAGVRPEQRETAQVMIESE